MISEFGPENDIIYFALEDGATLPTKREEDGCYDVYPYFPDDYIVIPPYQCLLIPTGVYSAFSDNYRISLRERGTASKWGIEIKSGQIDSGYRGQWFVSVYNENDIPIVITKNIKEMEVAPGFIRVPYSKAICQAALEVVPKVRTALIPVEELKNIKSERGEGCLGDSGK